MSPSRQERLRALRDRTHREERATIWLLSVACALPAGLMAALFAAGMVSPSILGFRIFLLPAGGFVLGLGLGLLVAYPIFVDNYRVQYEETQRLLTTTVLPQVMLDEGFQALVLEAVNRERGLRKLTHPPAFDDQLRFVARHWLQFKSVASTGSPEPYESFIARAQHEPSERVNFVLPRLRAICDFFLAS